MVQQAPPREVAVPHRRVHPAARRAVHPVPAVVIHQPVDTVPPVGTDRQAGMAHLVDTDPQPEVLTVLREAQALLVVRVRRAVQGRPVARPAVPLPRARVAVRPAVRQAQPVAPRASVVTVRLPVLRVVRPVPARRAAAQVLLRVAVLAVLQAVPKFRHHR